MHASKLVNKASITQWKSKMPEGGTTIQTTKMRATKQDTPSEVSALKLTVNFDFTAAANSVLSNSNQHKPIWHKSHCCCYIVYLTSKLPLVVQLFVLGFVIGPAADPTA
jgi:hypothetical protein